MKYSVRLVRAPLSGMKKVGDQFRDCDTCNNESGCRDDSFKPTEMRVPCFFWTADMLLVEDEKGYPERESQDGEQV